jgi:hypothetical protein
VAAVSRDCVIALAASDDHEKRHNENSMIHSDHFKSVQTEDLRPLSYAEFGQLLETLTGNAIAACRERGIRVGAVAPILRSGAFPGCHLASQLGVIDVLPLQYKHTDDPLRPVHSLGRVPLLTQGIAEDAIILIADTNTVTGSIAQRAAADLRAVLPASRIIFASVMLDISIEALSGIEFLISARRTNERRTLSREAARRVGVSNDVYIFPWEKIDEQWEQIQAARSAMNPK